MDENLFVEQLQSLLYKHPSHLPVTPHTPYRELRGWNVILAVSLLRMVHEEYNIELTVQELQKARTIADLCACIQARCQAVE